MSNLGFNAKDHVSENSFEPLPVGDYPIEVVSGGVNPTKSGGKSAVMKLRVTEGQYKGRQLFARFNIVNASVEAQRIGREQFGSFARACGVPECDDTAQLLGKDAIAHVEIDGQFNVVKWFNPVGAPIKSPAPAAARVANKTIAAPPPPAATRTKPWAKAAAAPAPNFEAMDDDIPF